MDGKFRGKERCDDVESVGILSKIGSVKKYGNKFR